MPSGGIVFIPLFVLVTLINIWWYRIKFILKNNGYKVDWFYNHWANFSQFRDLIRKSEPKDAIRYKRIFYTIIGFMITLIVLFVGGILVASYYKSN